MLPLIVIAASIVDLPSFPCRPTNSPIEAFICDDPELAAYDRAMALAYPRMKPPARAKQKAWLAERNLCGGVKKVKVCLRRFYTDRLLMGGGIFGTRENPKNAAVLTFLRSKADGPGGLALFDVGCGKFVYHLWASFFSYAYDPVHPQEISSDIFGVIEIIGGVGHEVATRLCEFTIKRRGSGWIISDADPCLGPNNNPNGTYLMKRR